MKSKVEMEGEKTLLRRKACREKRRKTEKKRKKAIKREKIKE